MWCIARFVIFAFNRAVVYGPVARGRGSGVIVCLACDFIPVEETEYHAKSAAEMIAHLQAHVAAGHKVPSHAFERLQKEEAEIDAAHRSLTVNVTRMGSGTATAAPWEASSANTGPSAPRIAGSA
jgi:hypothetical protein